jgi:hypothetical protein
MNNKILSLTPEEQIEYYLGKDRYPNKFFYPHIPAAWEIEFCNPAPDAEHALKDLQNTTIIHNGIEFKFNNLGYRAECNYTVDDLRSKQNILCISDSYVYGPQSHYQDLWTTQLQTMLPEYNIVGFGMPGWSFDTVARVASCVLTALSGSVDYVIVLPPNEHRREFVSKQYKKIISHPDGVTNVPYDDYWDHIDWQSNNYNYFKNSLLIKSMTESQGGKYIELIINIDAKNNKHVRGEKGLTSREFYTALSRYFYKKIKGLPSKFEEVR